MRMPWSNGKEWKDVWMRPSGTQFRAIVLWMWGFLGLGLPRDGCGLVSRVFRA